VSRNPLVGAWSRRSNPERFDTYTRWSLYVVATFELYVVLWIVGEVPTGHPALLAPLIGLSIAHTASCVVVIRFGLTRFLGGPPPPRWAMVTMGALMVATSAVGIAAYPTGEGSMFVGNTPTLIVTATVGFSVAACAPLVTFRWLALGALGVALISSAVTWFVAPARDALVAGIAVGQGIGVLIMCVAAFASYRVSTWMLGIVWEQERTRVLHARLAVAEERLRFSRDLHDVFGRTLSVVAVKSELAAELATRGRPGAAEQMLEVRQIAQDSLREVRAVVAGYRVADLAAELSGARSVLRSADIETTIDSCGDGEEESALPVATQEALAWVVREAVTNVVRHSDATRCDITLRVTRDDAVLTVTNDGVGDLDRGGARLGSPSGSGLIGLGERLAEVGGRLETRLSPPTFCLTASVPLPSPGGLAPRVALGARSRTAPSTPAEEGPTA
jgi:two-component system, NarL family, sensor histidine kinase DesK